MNSYIGAYWGSRTESAQECAIRMADCLNSMGEIDPALATWFRRGASKAAARTEIATTPESIADILQTYGRNRNDTSHVAMEELGFSIGLWNRARPSVGLSVTAGGGAETKGFMNSVVLDLPAPSDGAGQLYRVRSAYRLFESIVQAWDPTWATWITHAWRDDQASPPGEPQVGWMTYLRVAERQREWPATAQRFADGAIVVAEEQFDAVTSASISRLRGELQVAELWPSVR